MVIFRMKKEDGCNYVAELAKLDFTLYFRDWHSAPIKAYAVDDVLFIVRDDKKRIHFSCSE